MTSIYLHENLFEGRVDLGSLPPNLVNIFVRDYKKLSGSYVKENLPHTLEKFEVRSTMLIEMRN